MRDNPEKDEKLTELHKVFEQVREQTKILRAEIVSFRVEGPERFNDAVSQIEAL
jgi:hypothetical protein